MNLLIRLFWISLVSCFRKPVSILGPCMTPFRCWPTDLDVLRHMNNGKYLSILDLARIDLMTRSGVTAIISKQNWYPVIVAETIRFYKSLKLFNSFFVETIVLGWDEKAFILQQRFMKDEVCFAQAIVRARFLKKAGGTVAPQEVLQHAGLNSDPPQLTGWIQDWNQQQIK